MKWLWLEDERFSITDIEVYLREKRIEIEIISNLDDYYNKLIYLKKGSLIDYGLILDVKLDGTKMVLIPKTWSDQKDDKFVLVTDVLNNAGILFIQHAIYEAAEAFWRPIPPVIFLSTVPYPEYQEQIDKLKAHYNLQNRIYYVRKWDYDKELITILNSWR